MLCEMQSASSRVWTHVAVSISYDDNYYTMGSSIFNQPLLSGRIWHKVNFFFFFFFFFKQSLTGLNSEFSFS